MPNDMKGGMMGGKSMPMGKSEDSMKGHEGQCNSEMKKALGAKGTKEE